MKQEEHLFTALFEPAEDGGYVVTFPIPDLATQGETPEEAREMARDALRCYLEALQKDGEALPTDKPLTLEPVLRGGLGARTDSTGDLLRTAAAGEPRIHPVEDPQRGSEPIASADHGAVEAHVHPDVGAPAIQRHEPVPQAELPALP